MSERTIAQQESDRLWKERQQKWLHKDQQREGKVLALLRARPGLTNDEIWAAVQIGVGSIRQRFLRLEKTNGKVRWFFNEEKWNKFVSNQDIEGN